MQEYDKCMFCLYDWMPDVGEQTRVWIVLAAVPFFPLSKTVSGISDKILKQINPKS